jgi:cytochrome b561
MASSLLDSRTERYTRIAMLMHWLIALAMLAEIGLGWWMQDVAKSPVGLRAGWFNLHKSVGICLAMAVLLQLSWRSAHPAPHHVELPPWQRVSAELAHAVLYICMLVMPVSGYLGSAFSGYRVRFFGVALPAWAPAWPAGKEFFSTLHLAAGWLMMLIVAVHISAAMWHWLWHRDTVASRMGLPRWSRS